MTTDEAGLLDEVRQTGRLMMAGNGQYFEGIDHLPAIGFIYFYGETPTNQETVRDRIDDSRALELIRRYCDDHLKVPGALTSPSDAEALVYLRNALAPSP